MNQTLDVERAVSLVVVGASPDTTNLGVTALGVSVVQAIQRELSHVCISLFDFGRGIRSTSLSRTDPARVFDLCGAKQTRRFYLRESHTRIRFAARFGGLFNPAARRILAADAILDISGGDSFTDLYGARRFRSVCSIKNIALENNRPLILLPQTYGPFLSDKTRKTAERIVRAASMAWARDEHSFSTLRDLLGDVYDPDRHCSGVDVAFGLEAQDPGNSLSADLRDLLDRDELATRPIGVNVSGLIYNDPVAARERYGFITDYRELIRQLLTSLLELTDAPVVLVPHVYAVTGSFESDPDACRDARAALPKTQHNRIYLAPPVFSASEMKWIISRCQWFCGTRMHSAIAALSSEVPTAAIAYSLKTQGVFETCGEGEAVVDPRTSELPECLDRLLIHFRGRDLSRARLARHMPLVRDRVREQMRAILANTLESAAGQLDSEQHG